MTLSEVMHVHIPTLGVESTVRDAVDKMDIYQFPALVVVDLEKSPICVVTEGDICRAALQKGDITGLSEMRVVDIGSRHPICAGPDLEIAEALHLMLSQGVTILPVTSQERLLGIVLRVDLMQALLMDVASPLAAE
jgi:CBS domain-containing protein